MQIHFGTQAELTPDPPIAPIEPQGRQQPGDFDPQQLAAHPELFAGGRRRGLDFFPPKTEISVGAIAERRVPLRVFARGCRGCRGLRDWHLRVSRGDDLGYADARACWCRAAARWRGPPTWMATARRSGSWNRRRRARFSPPQDGGRWMEFTSKDANANFLPETGRFRRAGAGGGARYRRRGWSFPGRAGGERCG